MSLQDYLEHAKAQEPTKPRPNNFSLPTVNLKVPSVFKVLGPYEIRHKICDLLERDEKIILALTSRRTLNLVADTWLETQNLRLYNRRAERPLVSRRFSL